jgi:hypothetical protein
MTYQLYTWDRDAAGQMADTMAEQAEKDRAVLDELAKEAADDEADDEAADFRERASDHASWHRAFRRAKTLLDDMHAAGGVQARWDEEGNLVIRSGSTSNGATYTVTSTDDGTGSPPGSATKHAAARRVLAHIDLTPAAGNGAASGGGDTYRDFPVEVEVVAQIGRSKATLRWTAPTIAEAVRQVGASAQYLTPDREPPREPREEERERRAPGASGGRSKSKNGNGAGGKRRNPEREVEWERGVPHYDGRAMSRNKRDDGWFCPWKRADTDEWESFTLPD